MAEFITAKFTGDFEKKLAKLAQQRRQDLLFSAAAGLADVIYKQVVWNATTIRHTGNLADSIYQVHAPEKSTQGRVVYRVSWNRSKAHYGGWVEFGTSQSAANPFLRPALGSMDAAIAEGLRRMVVRYSLLVE